MKKINGMGIKILIGVFLLFLSLLNKNTNIFVILCYIILSYNLYIKAFKNITKKEIFDENFLMVIATLGAFYIGKKEEAIMVILLFQIGEYLSDLAVDKSKDAILKLMDLRSDKARIKKKDSYQEVKANKVKIGDIILIKPGEKIPLDGRIVKGKSYVDTSFLTGESIPRSVKKEDLLLSGYVNKESVLEIKVTQTFEKSTASKIIELMEKAGEKKTKTEKFITKFARIYTPIVVICALIITLIPVCLGYNFETFFTKSLIFLVISCPCALIISVPLGFFTGIGRASKEGILIKGTNIIDLLEKTEIVCFDKTGTITKGNFEVIRIEGKNPKEILEIAAHAEYYSNHPIAKSILKKYKGKIEEKRIKDYSELEGKGISVKIDNTPYLIGNTTLMKENKINIQEEIGTIIYIASQKEIIGIIEIADEIKEKSKKAINILKEIGVKETVMISGDNKETCKKIKEKVKIDKYYAEMLPIDKVKTVQELKKEGITIFVGDGINDAPVIKSSDIGFAMGAIGSDIAIDAADIVLMKDDLTKIGFSIKLSRKMKKIIKTNIIFAITVKACILLLGILGFSSIWAAVFADVGVTLLSILNALRIMKINI